MYINAMGHYVPSLRVDNDHFLNINGLTSDWIVQRTGIVTRSKCAEGENQYTMAIDAIDDARKRLTSYDVKDVDLIVGAAYAAYDTVATVGHIAQREYDINHAKVVYVTSACSSFINGLEVIEAYFAAGKATKALLICSEHNTYYSNESSPKDGHLWGDGAVAYFISKERMSAADWEIKTVYTEGLGNVGKGPEGVKLRPKEEGITMPDGRDVFIHACRYMIYALRKALKQCGMEMTDIDKIITHQANKRIVAQVAHQLELPMDSFINNIEELGNTGSASAPLVLSQHQDDLQPGAKVALTVFGGGYSCGTFIVQKPV
ncbi:MAG: ketoacyl-ACP synthase III [Muribaculaceae bacterium]|nr:ketoacyl-ACP synthase III [Muribaculaceae bacterium]